MENNLRELWMRGWRSPDRADACNVVPRATPLGASIWNVAPGHNFQHRPRSCHGYGLKLSVCAFSLFFRPRTPLMSHE